MDETEHELRCGCRGASGAFFNFVSGETIVHARRDNCAAELPPLSLSSSLFSPLVVAREGRGQVKLIICRASKDSVATASPSAPHLPRDFPLKGGGGEDEFCRFHNFKQCGVRFFCARAPPLSRPSGTVDRTMEVTRCRIIIISSFFSFLSLSLSHTHFFEYQADNGT